MRLEAWIPLAWLIAAGIAGLAWVGYRQPDMAFALLGWVRLCV